MSVKAQEGGRMPASDRADGAAQGLPRAWGGGDVLGIFRDSARPVGVLQEPRRSRVDSPLQAPW